MKTVSPYLKDYLSNTVETLLSQNPGVVLILTILGAVFVTFIFSEIMD